MKNLIPFFPLFYTLLQYNGKWHVRMLGRWEFVKATTLDEAMRKALLNAGIDPDSDNL